LVFPIQQIAQRYVFVLFFIVWAKTNYAQTADFNANNFSGCAPLSVKLSDNSSGTIQSWEWDFDNGNSSVLKDPGVIFITPGVYNVRLTVKDANNNTSDITKKFTVFKNPSANFTASTKELCVGSSTSFTNLSTQGDAAISSVTWDFGDGSSKTQTNPNHAYSSAGQFRITQLVKDGNGCKSEKTIANYIKVNPNPEPRILANKVYDCETPAKISFDNTIAKGTSPYTYQWNFGNSGSSSLDKPTETYNSAGIFSVSLEVMDQKGCKGKTTSQNLITIQPLIANFTSQSPPVLCGPTVITFKDLSSPSNLKPTYKWKFGDGDGSILSGPTHQYKNEGKYDVTLEIEKNGCKSSITKKELLEIKSLPKTDIILNDTIFCEDGIGKFNVSDFTYSKYEWEIGSQTFNGFSGNFEITKKGKHKTFLTVTDKFGCKNKITGPVIEYLTPLAGLIHASDSAGCIPFTYDFSDQSTSTLPITKYAWEWPNGNKGESTTAPKKPKTTYVFKDTGEFEIKYTVINTNGCKHDTLIKVEVGDKLKPNDIDASPRIVCPEDLIQGIDKSKNLPFTPHEKTWLIGNNSFSDDKNPGFATEVGYVDFGLVYTHFGCKDTLIKKDYIYVKEIRAKLTLPDSIKCLSSATVTPQVKVLNQTSFRLTYPDGSTTDNTVKPFELKPGLNYFLLVAKNDTMGCTVSDTANITLPFPLKTNTSIIESGICAPKKLTMSFTDDKNIERVEWIINDSIYKSDERNPDLANQFNHTLNVPGDYLAILKFYHYNGCTFSKDRKLVKVNGPTAKPSIKQLTNCFPMDFKLIDSLYSSTDGYDRYWLAGSDTIRQNSISQNITAQKLRYESGRYYLEYRVNDKSECEYVQKISIPISQTVPNISFAPQATCNFPNYRFSIFDFTLDDKTIQWFFDGVPGPKSTRITNHKFVGAGEHTVGISFTDLTGCFFSAEKTIQVDTPFFAAIIDANKTAGTCPPLTVKFINKSKLKANQNHTYLWHFGDGSTSTLMNPEKIYVLPNTYSVKLKIKAQDGCEDSVEMKDFITVKGPKGSYGFPESKGCSPVEVNFNFINEDAAFFKWDLADGTVDSTRSRPNHVYDRPGQYIPLMILADSFGCEYVLPPTDTIFVYPYPNVSIETKHICKNNPLPILVKAEPNYGDTLSYLWKFEDGSTRFEPNPIFQPSKAGQSKIELIISNRPGCMDTAVKTITVPLLLARHNKYGETACLNDTAHLLDLSSSDQGTVKRTWKINDSIYHQKNIVIHLTKKGPIPIHLWVEDMLGCKDSLNDFTGLLVGDTNPPPSLPLYRVSVENDQTVEVKYGQAQNIDFRKYSIHDPENSNALWIENPIRKDTTSFINWINTLNQTHCFKLSNVNACDKFIAIDSLVKHCTIDIKGKPDTNKSILNWNHYTGWPVERYEIYRDNATSPSGLQLVGQVNGDSLTFIDTTILCYTKHIYRVLAYEKDGFNETSWSDTCHVEPLWRNTVPLVKNWRVTVEDNLFTRLEWLQPKNPKVPVQSYIPFRYDARTGNYAQLGETPNLFIEDYKTKVNNLSYSYKVMAKDTCNDLSVLNHVSKSILLKASFNMQTSRPQLHWNSYFHWDEGVETYQIERLNDLGQFELIGQTSDTSFVDLKAPINCTPKFVYRVKAIRNQPQDSTWHVESVSNYAEAFPSSTLFAPSAFTPNGDNLNDLFTPIGTYISEYKLIIFNRWGEILFETTECMAPWNGIYKGENCMEGVYKYLIYAKGADNKKYTLKGDVTLLK